VSESLVTGSGGQDDPKGRNAARSGETRPRETRVPATGTGLRIYKQGQGFYIRVGTAIGAGVLIVAGAVFLYNELGGGGWMSRDSRHFLPIQWGVTTGFIVIMGAFIYWLVGRSRKINDFFIATEGEMKKVSWSTRKEVVRSTKVVIISVIILGVFLFLCDMIFILIFSSINVLKGPGLERLFGSGS